MQFPCFKPQGSSLWFQFRHCPNGHPKEMLGFARFFPASSNAFQPRKLSGFGNCVVSFDVVSANTGPGTNELSDNSIRYRILWNVVCKINNCFAKSGCSFFQIVNAFCFRFLPNKSCAIIPERIGRVRIWGFRFRHSFVIRHSSFVIYAWCNSVYSHSFANSQSRLTVTRAILSTSAISS
jgi:hypothetical protein